MKHSSKMDFVIPSFKKYSLQKYLHVIGQAQKFIKFARLWEKLIWQNIPTSLRLRPILGVGAIKAHGRGIRRHNAAGLGLHLDASSWCFETSGRVIVPISNSEIFGVWRGLRERNLSRIAFKEFSSYFSFFHIIMIIMTLSQACETFCVSLSTTIVIVGQSINDMHKSCQVVIEEVVFLATSSVSR